MREMPIETFLTVDEVAGALRLSASAIYRAIERGDVAAVRITERGALRIPAGELERILAGKEEPAA